MPKELTWTIEIHYALNALGTGPGVIAAGLIVALFLFSFLQAGRWLVLSLLLFSSTLSCGVVHRTPLIPLLAQLQIVSEVLTVILLGLLALPALLMRRGNLQTALLAASIAFWLLEVVYTLRVSGSVEITKAVAGVVVYSVLLLVLGYGLPRWLRSIDDVYPAVQCMGVAAMLFVGCTTVQLLVNSSAIIVGGRLFAITGNPQYAATVLAICLVPTAFLVACPRGPWVLRFLWGATTGMIIVLLIWTGSRTGVLMSLVGLTLLFRAHIGRLLGTGAVVAILVYAFLAVFQVSSESSSRLLSTLDTRSESWAVEFNKFLSNPILGKVTDTSFGTVENSYLTIAARSGLLGLSILFVVLCLIGSALRQLGRVRAAIPTREFRMLADMITGGIMSILAGAAFEGILVGTLTFMLLALYFYLGLLKFLTDAATFETIVGDGQVTQEQDTWPAGAPDSDPYGDIPDPRLEYDPRSF